jgi:hypothetical protein
VKRVLAVLAGLALAFVALTWWALEAGSVAVLETRQADGGVRRTHVWFVERDGRILVEAGTPENGWFQDVLARPELHYLSPEPGLPSFAATAVVLETPEAPGELRAALRRKYGLRDRWVSLLVDASRSRAVRLDPAPDPRTSSSSQL